VGLLVGGGGPSFLGYLIWKKGRKVSSATKFVDKDQNGMISVKVAGDNNPIVINQHIYNLSENTKALRATRDALLPVGQNGFDRVQLREGDKIVAELLPPEIDEVIASCTAGIEESPDAEPDVEVITAWLSVYSPVFDAKADL
jgi:hypothetical protein